MDSFTVASPPRARPVPYKAPLGTRWEKEKAAVPKGTFDFPEDPEVIGPWVIGECLGKGASGRVKVAQNSETGQMAAVKILPLEAVISSRLSMRSKDAKAEKHRSGIDKEIIMMKLMNHPNIVRIYDVFEGEKELYLILEYVDGGELFDYLVNNGRMDPIKALCYFKQIIAGLNYAHTFSIIHRDLKPENILIKSIKPPHIQIADWGMAAFAPPSHQLETSCGSPHYASPEIVNGKRYSGTATDIWSCGVILFALLTGRLPFDDKNIKTLLGKVRNGKFDMPTYVHAEAADLIRRMLVVDSERRITMADILVHPYVKMATPGILYVPAPPISELDRPLRSPAHIKSDLARSLLVICIGSTYDDIVAELLSPAGHGSLTKALYYLLAKHREQTLEEYGDCEGAIEYNIRHYDAPPPKKNRESMSTIASPAVSQLSPPPSAFSPSSPGRSALRSRPPSPVGPRSPRSSASASPAPKPRPFSTPSPPKNLDYPDTMSERKTPGVTQSAGISSRRRPRTRTMDGLPKPTGLFSNGTVFSNPNDGVPAGLTRRATLHGSALDTGVKPPALPPVAVSNNDGTWFIKAPSVADASLQRAMDDIAGKLNIMSALKEGQDEGGQHQSVTPESSPRVSKYHRSDLQPKARRVRKVDATKYAQAIQQSSKILDDDDIVGVGYVDQKDKENKDSSKSLNSGSGDGSFMKVDADDRAHEIVKEVRSKKRSSRTRHSVFSDHQAPSHAPAVVGEFKGWFANLFNWKAQQYVLHSVDNCTTTRDEVIRLLEAFGCLMVLQVDEQQQTGWGTLKCRYEDSSGAASVPEGNEMKKGVRFRVEFAPILGYSRQIGGGAQAASPAPSGLPNDNATNIGAFPLSPKASGAATSRMSVSAPMSSIVLIQEKGALSTFRFLYQRLRDEWALQPLMNPEVGVAGASAGVHGMGTPRIR